jgi:hypothetical protein
MELLNGTENRIRELDKNVWGYCINMTKYVLVDFSKIIEDLGKIYTNTMSFGYIFGSIFKLWINDNDDGDEILIVRKSVFGNTVLGKFVLIRKRNNSETKMIIDKIDNESGLKNFCVNRNLGDKKMERGLIFHKDFFNLIIDLRPPLGQITEYLIYVKQKSTFLTERLDLFFTYIRTKLKEHYKEEEKVNKMIESYVGDTINYIEPSVPLVFPDLEVGQPFSEKTRYGTVSEVISEITQYNGYKEYKVGKSVYPKYLYDYLDENGQKLIDLNNNATPGGNPKKTRRRKNKKRRSSKQRISKK